MGNSIYRSFIATCQTNVKHKGAH